MEEIDLGFRKLLDELGNDIYSKILLEEIFKELISGKNGKYLYLSGEEGSKGSENSY